MHIKQIRLSNFRSFRDQTSENVTFVGGMNSVIGRNGSGKSNLFDAVQFVLLAPRFATLRQEERQALLHEGSGSAAVNAYVEVVFDNADHRLQLDNADEVVLRRTIGVHKDEFFLQRRKTTKAEVQSLLEGAGFSKSNPYFMVQQGKVQDLCTMSDEERLTLLQQVAGTVVYDEKKAESTRQMNENAGRREKILGLLGDMDQRLDELSHERDELAAYSKLDRHRRAVEYSLYQAECTKARSWLAALEDERAKHASETVQQVHEQARTTHEAITRAHAVAQRLEAQLKRAQKDVQHKHEDYMARVQAYGQCAAQCKALEEAFEGQEQQFAANQKELKTLEKEIAKAQKKLETKVQPAYEKAQQQLQEFQDDRERAVQDLQALYAKQGRSQQFDTKEERDVFLKKHVKELEKAAEEKEEQLGTQRDALAGLRRSLETADADLKKANDSVQETLQHRQSFRKNMDEKKALRLKLHDQRKESWRQAETLRDTVRQVRDDFHKSVADRHKTMPRATRMGLQALKKIVQEDRQIQEGKHYFGSVMDNFELRNPKYATAVEAAAQNSLFHVIVDTDETASRLLTRLEKGKLGRVTFLPLNQLRSENVQYPDTPDAKPLLNLCLKYDKAVDRAMRQVFDKKLICRSPEVASEWSQKLGMDALTLDGDLCSRKGALTGGYVDSQQSRIGANNRMKAAQEALANAEADFQEHDKKAKEVDQSTTKLMQELQSLEAKFSQLGRLLETKEAEVEKLSSRHTDRKKQVEHAETTTVPALERALTALQGDIQRVKDEMATDLTKTLSDEERERVQELKQLQTDLAAKIEKQNDVVATAGVERQKLQSLLEDNMHKRRRELVEGTDESDGKERRKSHISSAALQEQRKLDLEESRRDLESQARVKDECEELLNEARAKDEEYRQEMIGAKNELEQLQSQDSKNMKALAEVNEKTERLLNKRSICISKRETYTRKIQELGSLPPPAEIEKVADNSISQLMKMLESINRDLKKYSHVNKKAFDQFVNFSEQRESLIERREELDRGAKSVKELIESLDQKKDEAINRTFRGVKSHFKDVFSELVPNGAGELLMRTAMDDTEEGGTDDEDSEGGSAKGKSLDASNPDVSLYRGVGIKVRFSAVGENYIMSQLSGGQKALVALALIFAIQRCDPAPFYLFDELDQALDSSYRASVADLIKRQASSAENPTQFIVSTFRPELVAASSRWFGVSHQNKASLLHALSKNDSLHFIANLMNEEEAVGEVTTVATSRKSILSKASRKRKSVEEADDENTAITAEG